MTRSEILDLLGRRQQALERRDIEAYAAFYAETATLESPLAGSATGRAAVKKFHAAFLAAFPDAEFVWDPPIIDGDRVAISAFMSGTDSGGFMGLPPTGRSFRLPVVFLLVVRDGYVVHDRRVYDFTGLLVQVGVLKAKPA